MIYDDQARVWQVRWRGWEDQLPVERVKTGASNLAQVFQPLGDLDDGDERLVGVRPDGAANWCKLTAHLS